MKRSYPAIAWVSKYVLHVHQGSEGGGWIRTNLLTNETRAFGQNQPLTELTKEAVALREWLLEDRSVMEELMKPRQKTG